MTKLQITKSDKEGKKFKAIFTKDDLKTKTVHFGSSMHNDYTQHKNLERRRLYRQRHEKDLKSDATRAGYLSYYILWGNSINLEANLRSFKNKFGFT